MVFVSQTRGGFTLIEVMLTMALLAVLALFASPFYGQFIYSEEVPVVRDELAGSFSKAKLYSMEGKNASPWGVVIESGRIVLFQGASFGARDQSFDEVFVIHPQISVSGLDDAVVFVSVTGRPDREPTITISGNGATETFHMNREGILEE